MKHYLTYLCLLALLSFGVNQNTFANNDATQAYMKERITTQGFSNDHWADASSGLKYSKKPIAKKTKKKKPSANGGTGTLPPPPPPVRNPITFKEFAQTLLIFLAIIILAFVIFKAVAGDAVLVNKQIRRNKPVTLEEIEKNLHEADVESFLKKALADKDYRLAIRLYYLAIIKELSIRNSIEWKKEKTNGHYMRELRSKKHPKLKEFKNVTRIFEYVWYSNMAFDGGQFEEVRIAFKDLLTSIK